MPRLPISAQRVGNIQGAMSLEEFLNPEDEDLAEQEQADQQVDLEDLIRQHTGQVIEGEEAAVEDEQGVEMAAPSCSEALRALELLQSFHEHQEGAAIGEIRILEQFERSIRLIISNHQQQRTLVSWFT